MSIGDRSEATKRAIREAAERLFVERGFEATNVRDIASAAGVNHALVIRHFGSKEGLFLRTVLITEGLSGISTIPVDTIGRELVGWALTQRRHGRLGTFAALLGAAHRPEVRGRFEQYIGEELVPRLAGRSSQADATLRAHLFATQFFGLVTTLALDLDPFLQQAPEAEVVAIYGDGMQRLLTP